MPTDGSIHLTDSYRCGAVVSYECQNGFGLLGTVYRDCVTSGQWRGSAPSCLRILTYDLILIAM